MVRSLNTVYKHIACAGLLLWLNASVATLLLVQTLTGDVIMQSISCFSIIFLSSTFCVFPSSIAGNLANNEAEIVRSQRLVYHENLMVRWCVYAKRFIYITALYSLTATLGACLFQHIFVENLDPVLQIAGIFATLGQMLNMILCVHHYLSKAINSIQFVLTFTRIPPSIRGYNTNRRRRKR